MIWQNTIYTIPVIIIIFFSFIGTFYLWIYRKGTQDIIGITIMILSIIWMTSSMLEQGFTDYQIKVFWNNIQYTGSLISPVCIFLLIKSCSSSLISRQKFTTPAFASVIISLSRGQRPHIFLLYGKLPLLCRFAVFSIIIQSYPLNFYI